MCIMIKKTETLKKPMTAWKRVRSVSFKKGVFTSAVPKFRRSLQDGYKTLGAKLKYTLGRVTFAAKHSPGIYLFKRRNVVTWISGDVIIRVTVPKGARVLHGSRGQMTASRVKVEAAFPK